MNNRSLFDKKYFEEEGYGKQSPEIIERNYKVLLKETHRVFPEMFRRTNGIKVLDFGCGYGIGTNYLSKVFDGLIVGVDISKYAIRKANNLFSKTNLKFYCLDLSTQESLKFLIDSYEYFDIVFTRDVLEHIPKAQQEIIVKNLSTLLRRGGAFIAAIPNGLNPYSYIVDKTHIGLRSPWSWRKIFSKYLDVIKIYEKQWLPFLWRLRKDKKLIEIRLPLIGFMIYLFARRSEK